MNIKKLAAEVREQIEGEYVFGKRIVIGPSEPLAKLLDAIDSAEEAQGVMGKNGNCVCLEHAPKCTAQADRLCRPMTFLMFPEPQSLLEAAKELLSTKNIGTADAESESIAVDRRALEALRVAAERESEVK